MGHWHEHDAEHGHGHGHRGRRFMGPGGHRRRGLGPWAFGPGGGPWGAEGRFDRDEWVRRLEEYQRDLEQEAADVADLIGRLKADRPGEPAQTGSV
jgi:hypothetical protein